MLREIQQAKPAEEDALPEKAQFIGLNFALIGEEDEKEAEIHGKYMKRVEKVVQLHTVVLRQEEEEQLNGMEALNAFLRVNNLKQRSERQGTDKLI